MFNKFSKLFYIETIHNYRLFLWVSFYIDSHYYDHFALTGRISSCVDWQDIQGIFMIRAGFSSAPWTDRRAATMTGKGE